jgi:hypothetical protein
VLDIILDMAGIMIGGEDELIRFFQINIKAGSHPRDVIMTHGQGQHVVFLDEISDSCFNTIHVSRGEAD